MSSTQDQVEKALSTLDETRAALTVLYEERDKRKAEHDSHALTQDLSAFVREAWQVLKPAEEYHHNWHIEAICEHLQAVSRGEILRLQIWVPRGTMKSLNVSVFWPAWEWTRNPGLRYWTASYELGLSKRLARMSLMVMRSKWYQRRWGDRFRMVVEQAGDYANDMGGTRLATAPGSTALGEHGHRIIIDDPINAAAADATSRAVLDRTNDWYDSSIEGSKARPKTTAEVIIMQRLHEDDLAQHAYDTGPEEWTILCLPERYEADHPFAWRGDPRGEGELLWPEKRGEKESQRLARTLTSHRAAGQMQQRPAAREGEILKRNWWRFYDPRLFSDGRMVKRRPRFAVVVQSVDTPLKDKETNDLVAIQAWGADGPNRYLLDLKKGHMNYCVPMDSEALTPDGWKRYWDLSIGDLVLGYDSEANIRRWTPIRSLQFPFEADIVEFGNARWSMRCTPEHAWVGRHHAEQWQRVAAQDFGYGFDLLRSAPTEDECLLDVTAAEAALIGWLVTDGNVLRTRAGTRTTGYIWQKHYQAKVMATMAQAGLQPEATALRASGVNGFKLPAPWLRDLWERAALEDDAANLEAFVLALGTQEREAFLDAGMLAEGHNAALSGSEDRPLGDYGRWYRWRFAQNPGPTLDAFLLAAHLCGYSPHLGSAASKCRSFYCAKPKLSGQHLRLRPIGRELVWCPQTELGTWTMRQGTTIALTGNSQCKRAVVEQARYLRSEFRRAAHHVLIENAGYGVELIEDLKQTQLTGVHKLSRAHEGDKILRAESAAADLESGNVFLPGYRVGTDEMSMPDERRTPADILDFIDSCAMFPNGKHDDDVDAWSQAMNWLRSRSLRRPRVWSSFG